MGNKPTYIETTKEEQAELNTKHLALGFCIAMLIFVIFCLWFSFNYEVCNVL